MSHSIHPINRNASEAYPFKNIFEAYVTDDTMDPEFKSNDTLYVSYDRIIEEGDPVLIILNNGTSLVKIYKEKIDNKYRFSQHKGKMQLELKNDEIRSIFRVMGVWRD